MNALRRSCHQTHVDNSGVYFTSCSATSYLSANVHHSKTSTKHPKSLWRVRRPAECHTFCTAEWGDWSDGEGDLWAVGPNAETVFGTRGERIAFFDAPVNETDPWHGYPVGGKRGLPVRRSPPDYLIQKWYDDGWITYPTYDRLLGRRI